MKNIFDYLQENLLSSRDSLITESFKATVFHEIQDQFSRYNKNEDEKSKANEWYRPDYIKFKSIFGSNGIAWSNIEDKDVKECSNENKDDVLLAKRIVAQRSNHIDGLIIILDDYNNAYAGIICSFNGAAYYYSFRSRWSARADQIRPSDVENMLSKKFYAIKLRNELMSYDIRNKRANDRWNSYTPGDEEYYKKVAEENRNRYKNILAKYKAERDANDGISEKVNEYTKKVLELAIKVSAEPLRYAKLEYKIGGLMDLIRDERQYNSGYGRNKGYYSGTNGLLYLYTEYLKTKLSMASGTSYDYERDAYNDIKKKIVDLCSKIDSEISKIESMV